MLTSRIGLTRQQELIKTVLHTRERLDRQAAPLLHPQMSCTSIGTRLSGFTITELLLVLTLIGVLSAISMPALKGFASTRRLKASAATLRGLLTFARDMAITDRTAYLVVFDLDTNRYWLASSETFNPRNPLRSALTAQNSTALAAIQNRTNVNNAITPAPRSSVQQYPLSRASGILGVPHSVEQNVTLAAMVTNYNGRAVQADSGVAYIHFSPRATSEETLVYLRNARNQIMSVTVEAASGRVRARQLVPAEIEMLGFTPEN